MASRSLYSPHPMLGRVAAFEANVKGRTGKTLDEWLALVKASGPPTEKERREWLMSAHHVTNNYAWWIAERAAGKNELTDYDPEAYVEAMFSGGKAGLRPLYDALLKLGLALGKDVKACPCQTIVPLYRQHVFAEFMPTTRTRIDLGLALQDTPFTGRLLDTGGRAKKERLTHRIAITRLEDIDDEVKRWLKVAYEMDAPGAKKARKPAAEVGVPADLQAALDAVPEAKAAFAKLPPSHRREYVESIEEAKKPETRARRIARAVEKITSEGGKKR